MYKKAAIQALSIIVLFFSSWFILMQLNWREIMNIEKTSSSMEEKLGEIYWDIFKHSGEENTNDFIVNSIDSIINKICIDNDINKEIKLHILSSPEINAFALPDGHLVIYSGLISSVSSQEELTGVICHELAHIELDHIMKKLIKEVGISVLLSMTSDNFNIDILRETAQVLSSTAFDRQLEREADLKAIDYMIKSSTDPELFANFIYLLSTKEPELVKNMAWFSTHPLGDNRVKYIIDYIKDTASETKHEKILKQVTWDNIIKLL